MRIKPDTAGVLLVAAVAGSAWPGRLALAGVTPWNTVWAEDGSVFLQGAVTQPLRSVLRAYGGYLNIGPRLLVIPARIVPTHLAAAFLLLLSSVAAAALCAVVFRRIRPLLGFFPSFVVAVSPACFPVTREEVVASLANLQWIALPAVFWICARPAPPGRRRAIDLTIVFLSCASSVFGLIPAVAGLIKRKLCWPYAVAMGAGAGIQGVAVLLHRGERQTTLGLELELVRRSIGAAVVANLWGRPSTVVDSILLLGFLLAVALIGIAVMRRDRLLGASVGVAMALAALTASLTSSILPRYLVAPGALFVAATLLAVPARARVPVSALIVVAWLPWLPASPYRAGGPRWSDALADSHCVANNRSVAIAPGEPWAVVLPC